MKQDNVLELETRIEKEYSNIAGMVVLKDGKTIYEKYFNECTLNSKIHVYSVSKSVISLLIGIAIDRGYIKDVNQKIIDFFPDYNVKKGRKNIEKITIKDLLTMAVPYKYKFMPITCMRYFMSDDWVKFTLDLLDEKREIGEFRYTPLVGPDILSGILVKATGHSVLEFATENVFLPLEISVEKNIIFHTVKEQQTFNKATDISGWVSDLKGINSAGWGLTLSAMDMAKIGQLYLDKGVWNKKRIVSSAWIYESIQEHNRWEKINFPYGYLWWITDDKENSYSAMGDGGNAIFFNKNENMVVSIASLFVPRAKDRIEFINDYVLPVFKSHKTKLI